MIIYMQCSGKKQKAKHYLHEQLIKVNSCNNGSCINKQFREKFPILITSDISRAMTMTPMAEGKPIKR
jgi:hypothetical protein